MPAAHIPSLCIHEYPIIREEGEAEYRQISHTTCQTTATHKDYNRSIRCLHQELLEGSIPII